MNEIFQGWWQIKIWMIKQFRIKMSTVFKGRKIKNSQHFINKTLPEME